MSESNEHLPKPAVLFLVHRIPFPPNKGDKIRSFNLLKTLSKHYDVFLGCFIDEREDIEHVAQLNQWVKEARTIKISPLQCKINGLSGFLNHQPITVPYYSNRDMKRWVEEVCDREKIQRCLIFSSSMIQFVAPIPELLSRALIDFVDVDSDKWLQYSQNKSGIKKWFYQREARLLEKYETKMATLSAVSSFVSSEEASLFRVKSGLSEQKVVALRNGVDTCYFDPDSESIDAIDLPNRSLVFTGAMDYWANINAVLWFVEHVWERVLERVNDARLFIVGSKPSAKISALDGSQNITVTGRVPDVRPYILQSSVSIAPLQIARGIQNKVLEALAMQKPVVLSSMAAEGISSTSRDGYWIENEPVKMASRLINLLTMPELPPYPLNRDFVEEMFSWNGEMEKAITFIENGYSDATK